MNVYKYLPWTFAQCQRILSSLAVRARVRVTGKVTSFMYKLIKWTISLVLINFSWTKYSTWQRGQAKFMLLIKSWHRKISSLSTTHSQTHRLPHTHTHSILMFIASCSLSIGQFPFIKSGGEMESAKATGIYHPLRPLTSTVPTLPTPTAHRPTSYVRLHKQQLYIFLYICSCVL